MDYLPTAFAVAGATMPDNRPVDGDNVLDLILGKTDRRARPIPFRFSSNNAPGLGLLDGEFRYYTNFDADVPEGDLLYNFVSDRGEQDNLIQQMPNVAAQMRKHALAFITSCRSSFAGSDYRDGYEPLGKWKAMKNTPWEAPLPTVTKKNKKKRAKRGRSSEDKTPVKESS